MIHKSLQELVGNTPLLELRGYEKAHKLAGMLAAKLEYLNPAGSVKDRAALAMLQDAEKKGILKPGAVIVEPTSGNTGIGLASAAASRGYRVLLTMPETMSAERRSLLKAYGAEIVLTPGAEGMSGAIRKAKELSEEIPGSFIPGQFINPANAAAHRETTGPEIWRDTDGTVDYFVAGVGTGGTITGAGEFLKSQNPNVQIIAVEPSKSAVLSGEPSGPHGIQGIGAGFVPEILNMEIVDQVARVSDEDAFSTTRELARLEGILVGISSGAAVWAAARIAEKPENSGKCIVVLLPDSGDRYLSTAAFSE